MVADGIKDKSILDSCATRHSKNKRDLLTNIIKTKSSVYMGDRSIVNIHTVRAIGVISVVHGKTLELDIEDVAFFKNLTANFESVSRICKKNLEITFKSDRHSPRDVLIVVTDK